MTSTPLVYGFAFDEINEEKLWVHGIMPEDVMQLLDRPYNISRNKKDRRGTRLLVGRDDQGRCIAVPIEPTSDPVIWRPVTGWFCNQSQWNLCP